MTIDWTNDDTINDREWDRHWATINTMLGCSCGDPNEITLHHSHATCLPKQVTR